MAVGSLKELYFDELGDLYDAETQMLHALPRLAEAAHAPELREVLVKHYEESRLHLERLQLIFTHWGERPGLHRCLGVAGIVQEADDRLNRGARLRVDDDNRSAVAREHPDTPASNDDSAGIDMRPEVGCEPAGRGVDREQ